MLTNKGRELAIRRYFLKIDTNVTCSVLDAVVKFEFPSDEICDWIRDYFTGKATWLDIIDDDDTTESDLYTLKDGIICMREFHVSLCQKWDRNRFSAHGNCRT